MRVWLVRGFRTVVLVLPGAVHHGRHDRAVRRHVATQFIGDQPAAGTRPWHCQVDGEQASSAVIDALVQCSELGTGRLPPDPEGLASHQAMVHGAE